MKKIFETFKETIVNEKLSRKERQKRKQEELDELLPKAKEIEKEYKRLKAEWQKNKTDHTEARYLAKEEQLRRIAKKIRYVRAEMFENTNEATMSLDKYKQKVYKNLKDKDLMTDEFFYEYLIGCFTKGRTPEMCVDLANDDKWQTSSVIDNENIK